MSRIRFSKLPAMWPKVFGHLGCIDVTPEPFISCSCCNSLHSAGKAFHQMLEPGCWVLFPFRGDKAWLTVCVPAHPKCVWEFFTDRPVCTRVPSC